MYQKQNDLKRGFYPGKIVYPLLSTLLVLVLFSPAHSTRAQTAADPLAIFNAFNSANNAGDVEGALNLFTDDAVVKFPPTDTYTGKAELRKWRERAKVTQDRVEVVGPSQVSGNKLTTVIRLFNTEFKAAGIDYLELIDEVTVQDGKIKELVGNPTPETLRKLQNRAPAIPASGQGGGAGPATIGDFSVLALILFLGFPAVVAAVFLSKLNHRVKDN